MSAEDRNATRRAGPIEDESAQDAEENRERLATANTSIGTFTAVSGQPSAPVIAGEGDRLEQRAIRRKWNVPKEKRREIIGRQIQIAVHGVKDGDAIRAFKAILLAERQDDLRTGKIASGSQVNVTVQVAAREAAVFGDLAAFKAAAAHQAKQVEQQGTISPVLDSISGDNTNTSNASVSKDSSRDSSKH